MTDRTKSPSRMAGYAETMRGLVARDGLVCFLCGHKHATVHTMQGDMRNPAIGFELENLVIACKPCAKRRNGKRIGAYWRERKSAAAAEIAHINMMVEDQEVLKALSATLSLVPNAVEETGHAEADPFALPENPTVYNYDRMLPEDFDDGYPANPKHGDVYYYTGYVNGQDEYVFDGKSGKWKGFAWATKNDLIPEDWPPVGAVHHRL
jgi:hypothetical protein